MLDIQTPYLDMYLLERPRLRPAPKVLHRQTCPVCGKKLVNTYYQKQTNTYICKKCMDNSNN